MKKIGILTFYLNHNYGSSLQCYALKKAIESIGDYQVHVIPHTFVSKIENGFGEPELFAKYERRIALFDNFLKKDIGCTECHMEKLTEENAPDDDVYIVGSDVVWDTTTTGNDTNFFLDFAKDMSVRKVAYGVGLNVTNTDVLNKEVFAAYVDKFDHLSLREDAYRDYVKQFTTKPIWHVLDPTFLLSKEHYLSLIAGNKEKRKGYILLYLIYDDSAHIQKVLNYANRIAMERDWDVIHFIYNIPDYVFGDRGKTFAFEGPKEFLWYVAHADMVITSSFHGTAFSIIFQRPFYTVRRHGADIKTMELLRCLGLEDREMVYGMDIRDVNYDIEYSRVEKVLKKRIADSYSFLEHSLI